MYAFRLIFVLSVCCCYGVSINDDDDDDDDDNELRNYSANLQSVTEDTDAVQYWVSKESQYL